MVRRSEFLKANGGTRVPMPAFVLLVRPRGDAAPDAGYGITATKKLGGAVIRNRAKRRFRAIIRDQFPLHATAGADHVLIARADALNQGHAALTADVVKALGKAKRRMGASPEPGGRAVKLAEGEARVGVSSRHQTHLPVPLHDPTDGPPPRAGEDS
jgi:ribonuclease P protein component